MLTLLDTTKHIEKRKEKVEKGFINVFFTHKLLKLSNIIYKNDESQNYLEKSQIKLT